MSILGALQAGVSALGAQSTAMAAVSDNIANMNTTCLVTRVEKETLFVL